ncbi:hypothetical protein PFAG_04231 [Plasmodium falciparum Santa Lucia]|uniref:Rifin n=2 Tax=Plasmodium falciparum TaxID=5833 RepID=A0A0L7KKF1_PLAFX|nr:hypothetical protein PFAG_04231 [Plasmodium falciparum Santa Lucia]KOB63818.1 hypothetical protein PFHG_04725 [Plasmodium falciparum HB3]
MKVHYINILLFALPLNLLVYNQRNHYITRTPKATTRTLCECELYAPSIYDNDPEMKAVMEIFNRQTSERLREYDERMQDKRQKCKEQCEKDIQKIILKDKIEKELAEKFVTLQTDISINDIPTCVCEKSVADKVEKTCLKCGGVLGGGVTPAWGLVSGVGYVAWTQYVATTVAKSATDAGISKAIELIISKFHIYCLTLAQWKTIITAENYANEILLGDVIRRLGTTLCGENSNEIGGAFCLYTSKTNLLNTSIKTHIPTTVKQVIEEVASVKTAEIANFVPKTMTLTTTIIASVVAIVVIILVMVIIYLILRSRRRKKMTKKRQYVKLLKG